MSFDRKNKRAAQQALRDAQAGTVASPPNGHPAAGHDPASGIFGSPDSTGKRTPATSPQMQARGLPHDLTAQPPLHFATIARGPTATFVAPARSGLSHHLGSSAAPQPIASEARGSVAAHAMLSEQARRLSSTSESLSPPRLQQLSRARLSFNASHGTGNGGSAAMYGASPPLAVPGTLGGNNGVGASGPAHASSAGIFGTSPFSSSRGLFMPSSYDSNEDGFPRSPPVRHAVLTGEMQRSPSGTSWRNAIAIEDDPDAGPEDEDYDEGFLPSSLNDLLTPEEMRRRTMRAQAASSGGHHLHPSHLGPSSRSAFDSVSNSVPADLLLAAGKPVSSGANGTSAVPAPTLGERSMSAFAEASWPANDSGSPRAESGSLLAQSRTREPTLVAGARPAVNGSTSERTVSPTTASLLSSALSGARPPRPTSRQTDPHLLTSPPAPAAAGPQPTSNLGMYSASFSNASVPPIATYASAVSPPTGPNMLRDSPHRGGPSPLGADLATAIAVPGSLPTGLAAGLSRLHLVPPAHTGETPPSQSGSYFGSGGTANGHGQSEAGRSGAAVSGSFGMARPVEAAVAPDSGVGLTTVGSPLRSEVHRHAYQFAGEEEDDDDASEGTGAAQGKTQSRLDRDRRAAAAARTGAGMGHAGRHAHEEDGFAGGSGGGGGGGRTEDEDERVDEGDVEIQFDMEVA